MRRVYKLTVANPVQVVDLDFLPVTMAVSNPTASNILIRKGAPDTPTAANADEIIPSAVGGTIAIKGTGYMFCLALGSPSLVTLPSSAIISGLEDEATISFLDETEIVPTYGIYSFLSLSLSDLTQGFVAYAVPVNSAAFDLQAWGGAVVGVFPGAASGQASVQIQVSSDAVTWRVQQFIALWPGIPITIQVARIARYMRVSITVTGIVGEPAISGEYTVRATLSEITENSWAVGIGSITKAYNVPNLSTRTVHYVTVGLKSVAIKLNNTSGNRAEMVWYTSPDLSTWSLVAFREQSVAGFYSTIFRSIGNMDAYLRVDILEIGNTGPIIGNLIAFIQNDPDLTSVEQQQLAALGDVGQPTNTNQSIYHELDTIRQRAALLATEATLLTRATEATLSTLYTASNNYFAASAALLTAGNVNTAAINTTLLTAGGTATSGGVIIGSGAFINYGAFLPPNIRVYRIVFSWNYTVAVGLPAVGVSRLIRINVGTAGAPNATLATFQIPTELIWNTVAVAAQDYNQKDGNFSVDIGGTTSGGFQNGATQNLWMSATDIVGPNPNMNSQVTFYVR